MADQYLTQLSSLSSPASGDLLYVVDVSDTTSSSGGTEKKMAVSELYTLDTINVDTISEKTSANGVTIDGVSLKDSAVVVDTISEKTAAAGVTIDGVKLKDSAVVVDTISEKTGAAGVTIDGLKIKDSGFALGSDADGDIYYRSSGALTRLAKGTAGQVLTMNSGASAPEWAEGLATDVKFGAYANANQTLTNANQWYTLEMNTEFFDTGSDYNTSTYTFTVPITGYYHFSAMARWATTNVTAGSQYYLRIAQGGTSIHRADYCISTNAKNFSIVLDLVRYCTAAQTYTCDAYSDDDAGTIVVGQAYWTKWSAHLLSV